MTVEMIVQNCLVTVEDDGSLTSRDVYSHRGSDRIACWLNVHVLQGTRWRVASRRFKHRILLIR